MKSITVFTIWTLLQASTLFQIETVSLTTSTGLEHDFSGMSERTRDHTVTPVLLLTMPNFSGDLIHDIGDTDAPSDVDNFLALETALQRAKEPLTNCTDVRQEDLNNQSETSLFQDSVACSIIGNASQNSMNLPGLEGTDSETEIPCDLCMNCRVRVCGEQGAPASVCLCQFHSLGGGAGTAVSLNSTRIHPHARNFNQSSLSCECYRNDSVGVFGTKSPLIPNPANTTISRVGIWERGVLNGRSFSLILRYFYMAMPVPCVLSLLSAFLSVKVISQKSFVYKGKELVISFNIIEALKCVMYMIHRLFRVYLGRRRITWNHPYSRYFLYVAMWFPDALGRITILLNCIITLDRFFALAFPFRVFRGRLVKRPKTCVAAVVLLMLLCQVYYLVLLSQVAPNLNQASNFTSSQIISYLIRDVPPTFQTPSLVFVYVGAVLRYCPLTLTLIFSSLTSCSLYRHTRRRKRLLSHVIPPKLSHENSERNEEEESVERKESHIKRNTREIQALKSIKESEHTGKEARKENNVTWGSETAREELKPNQFRLEVGTGRSPKVTEKKPAARLSSSQAFTTQTNVMIVTSSVIVALLVFLKPLIRLLGIVVPDFGENKRELYLYRLINEICMLLDNTIPLVNLLTYNALSSQFRRRLSLLLTPHCLNSRRGSLSTETEARVSRSHVKSSSFGDNTDHVTVPEGPAQKY